MKINWSLMNRLGLNEPEGEFASFTPQGAGAAASSGNGGAGNGDADDDEDDSLVDDDEDDDLDPAAPTGGAAKQPRQAIQMDPETMIRQVSEATARAMRQGQAQGQPQLTEAEIQQRLGRPTVSEELIAQLRNPEITPAQMAKALQELQDGTYRYAMTTTQHLLQHQMAPLLEMQQQFVEQQRAQREVAFRGNLIRSYPALKRYDAAIGRAMAELTQEGFKAQGLQPEQIYKTVAQRARKLIREIQPDFTLKQQQAQGQHRQAGSLRTQRTGQGSPGTGQAYGAASFSHII